MGSAEEGPCRAVGPIGACGWPVAGFPPMSRGALMRRGASAVAVMLLGSLGLVFAGPAPSLLRATPVQAATSDPVIAVAGDIACDPTNSNFNGGNGSSNACRELSTSNLLVNANLAAVLNLGDNQYYCGGYTAFLQSYGPTWGRVKSITHPAVGNHEYLTSGGPDCNSQNAGASGYFSYLRPARGP